MEFTAAVVAVGFVGYALVSRRLDRSPVTGTIVFTALGLVIGPELLGLADLSGLAGDAEVVRLVLVSTLVVVLFSDASAITSAPWHDDVIPARMLGIGLPVMIALGWVGAALVLGPVLAELTWSTVLYGVLTLVVFRLVAVGVALLGSGLAWRSVLYLGWFGPRGLATIILSIEILELAELDGAGTITDTSLFAVGLSVLTHGATAWWGSNAYADAMEVHPAAGSMAEDQRTVAVRTPRRFEHPMS